MNYTVKNVKTFRGREGQGFNATLYVDGRKIAEVDDSANGGCYRWWWVDTEKNPERARADEAALNAHIATLPPVDSGIADFGPLTMDADLFVSMLVEDVSLNKQIAGWCRKSVAFLSGKEIRRTKGAPTPTLIATIERQYPGAVILNTMAPADALAAVKAVMS